MFSVKLEGFKTKEAAEAFVSWFEGQGEQDVYDVWELWGPRDKDNDPPENIEELVGKSPHIDLGAKGYPKWDGDSFVAKVTN